jgi:hypothetical protein
VLSCVDRGLYDGLINRPKESYQVSKQITKPPVCETAKVLTRTVQPLMNGLSKSLRLHKISDQRDRYLAKKNGSRVEVKIIDMKFHQTLFLNTYSVITTLIHFKISHKVKFTAVVRPKRVLRSLSTDRSGKVY